MVSSTLAVYVYSLCFASINVYRHYTIISCISKGFLLTRKKHLTSKNEGSIVIKNDIIKDKFVKHTFSRLSKGVNNMVKNRTYINSKCLLFTSGYHFSNTILNKEC